jgi:NTE family protein
MKRDDLRIALALSGGGVRAAAFHLGVLARLARDNLFEQITYLSTVSGGSLVTGLIYSIASRRWPTSAVFLNECLPKTYYYLTKTNLQSNFLMRAALKSYLLLLLQGRASVLSASLKGRWNITGTLQDLLTPPRWLINASPYESGKNWRFEKNKMGDYVLNYVENPPVDIAGALAASAGFPGFIGSLELKTADYTWFKYGVDKKTREPYAPKVKSVHLWDGGVYDNMGLEALYKEGREFEYRDEYNFLIASDAGKGIEVDEGSDPLRIIEIMMSQVGGLRARSLVNHFIKHKNSGVYLKIGNAAEYILKDSKQSPSERTACINASLSAAKVRAAANYETTLKKMTDEDFSLLFRHGWEVADYTLIAYCPGLFDHVEYKRPQF